MDISVCRDVHGSGQSVDQVGSGQDFCKQWAGSDQKLYKINYYVCWKIYLLIEIQTGSH